MQDDPGVVAALDALERYARAFDEISAEADAHYSAAAFVRWVKLETRPPAAPVLPLNAHRMLTESRQHDGTSRDGRGPDGPIHAQSGTRRDCRGLGGTLDTRLRT